MNSKLSEPRPIYREGKKVEMYAIIDELDEAYQADLKASVCVGTSYEEVSGDTYNDLEKITHTLELLEKFGYLTTVEYYELKEEAANMRLKVLEDLENFDEFKYR